jgi:cell division cycle 2-like protein
VRSRWLDEDSDEGDEEAELNGQATEHDSAAPSRAAATSPPEAALPAREGGTPRDGRGGREGEGPPAAGPSDASDALPSMPSMPPTPAAHGGDETPAYEGSASGGGARFLPPSAAARGLPPRPGVGQSPMVPKRCRSVDAFEKIGKIDEGTYGVVFKAKDRASGDIVALKQVKMPHSGEEGFPPTALREINVLLSLHHQHVINTREMVVGDTLDKIYMVMDYMDHDIKQLMNAMKQPFTAAEVKRLMFDLTSALEYRWRPLLNG